MAVTKRKRVIAGILFAAYLVVLCYFLFFSEEMGRTYSEREYHYNLVPLKEIWRFLYYWRRLGMGVVIMNIVGNIVAFVPFGTFLPIFSEKLKSFWRVVLWGFDFSLCVELVQLVSKVGSFDVDDLLLNTIGVACGYGVHAFFCRHRKQYEKNEIQ